MLLERLMKMTKTTQQTEVPSFADIQQMLPQKKRSSFVYRSKEGEIKLRSDILRNISGEGVQDLPLNN